MFVDLDLSYLNQYLQENKYICMIALLSDNDEATMRMQELRMIFFYL